MTDRFDPRQFEVVSVPEPDFDADWMQVAEKLPALRTQVTTAQAAYIPAVPLSFLQAVLVAGDAIPILLVALAEMRKRATSEIAIGPAIWSKVGDPTPRVRTRLLKLIGSLPTDICSLTPRTGRPHLLVTGQGWPKRVTGGLAPAWAPNKGC